MQSGHAMFQGSFKYIIIIIWFWWACQVDFHEAFEWDRLREIRIG